MSLFYAIENGNTVTVHQTSSDARKCLMSCQGAVACRVITDRYLIDEVVNSDRNTRPRQPRKSKISHNEVPVRGHPVAYLLFVFSGKVGQYVVRYKLPGEDWIVFSSKIEDLDAGMEHTIGSLAAIEDLLQRVGSSSITIYVKNLQVCNLLNKSMPLWKLNDWIIKHPPKEFERIRTFSERVEKFNYTIKYPDSTTTVIYEQLKTLF